MTKLQSDDRFSEEFFQEMYDRFGIEDEDYTLKVLGSTFTYYFLEIRHAGGKDQMLYTRKNNTWEFIT